VLARLADQARQEAASLAKQVDVLRKASALRDDERLRSSDQTEVAGALRRETFLDSAVSMDLA